MSIESKHPEFMDAMEDWQVMRDTYGGQRMVKNRNTEYLPATSGMLENGQLLPNTDGYAAYMAYKKRALFPDLVAEAVERMIGVMHRKPPVIDLPDSMQGLIDHATNRGESLASLLRRINEAQLVYGRCGLLVDLPANPSTDAMPYLALYDAESIINWDATGDGADATETLNLVVLDETCARRKPGDLEWSEQEQFRLLVIGEIDENERQAVYGVAVYDSKGAEVDDADLTFPSLRGQMLQEIPFTFINSKDIVPSVDNPPLIGLAETALAIYRGDADYRQALFMQGQDTLFIAGVDAEQQKIRLGAHGFISSPDPNAKAEFIGVNSQGLPEMRQAQENDFRRAGERGSRLLDQTGGRQESGEALKVRMVASTTTLNQVAIAGAYGLETSLKQLARWIGANPDDVKVTPNLDFENDQMSGQNAESLAKAKLLGFPISWKSIHALSVRHGLTEMSYDDEMAEIEAEAPDGGSLTDAGA